MERCAGGLPFMVHVWTRASSLLLTQDPATLVTRAETSARASAHRHTCSRSTNPASINGFSFFKVQNASAMPNNLPLFWPETETRGKSSCRCFRGRGLDLDNAIDVNLAFFLAR
jgi:hypothetical protein